MLGCPVSLFNVGNISDPAASQMLREQNDFHFRGSKP